MPKQSLFLIVFMLLLGANISAQAQSAFSDCGSEVLTKQDLAWGVYARRIEGNCVKIEPYSEITAARTSQEVQQQFDRVLRLAKDLSSLAAYFEDKSSKLSVIDLYLKQSTLYKSLLPGKSECGPYTRFFLYAFDEQHGNKEDFYGKPALGRDIEQVIQYRHLDLDIEALRRTYANIRSLLRPISDLGYC